ncbi:GNAT family N-acetyltransferase [Microbacterium sp. JZ70]
MAIRIRPVAPQDLADVERIENEADRLLVDLLAPERWDPAPAGADRAAQPGFLLVAEGDALVGFAHVLEVDGAAHLEQLSVVPAFGRQGIGRRLVDAVKDEARRRGHASMTLRTFAEVPWNAPFYARCGFIEEQPTTAFERGLVATEQRLGLDQLGRRIQMRAVLHRI